MAKKRTFNRGKFAREYYERRSDVSLYAGPGTHYSELQQMPAGTSYTSIGYEPFGVEPWQFIEADGMWGWMLYNRGDTQWATPDVVVAAKPVIYLYPQQETEVAVQVELPNGHLTCTYPEYNGSWNVTAYPDGRLLNHADGQEYSYLFWEGVTNADYDLSSGFVVAGKDTAVFLQEKLAYMGLTPKEYNEFIVYWLPKMQENQYNLVTFQTDAYTDAVPLHITPQPDSMLRIFMVYQPLNAPISIPQPSLIPFERTGFYVVEWGGVEIV